jgi:RNA polymerase sigma factor (sigma-70 family)
MDEPETRQAAAPGRSVADTEFAAFYRSFMPGLVAFLRYQGVPLKDAADLAQETMIKAYARWSTIDTPRAWTKRVASRAWARRLAGVDEALVADVPEPLLAVSDVAIWEQQHDILRVLDRLPPRQRQVLAWTLDGHTPAEIAEELRLPSETVRANLYKARRAVAKHLEEERS